MADLSDWKRMYAYCYFQKLCDTSDAFIQTDGHINTQKQIAFFTKINTVLKERAKVKVTQMQVQNKSRWQWVKQKGRNVYQAVKSAAKSAGQFLWNYGPAILAGIVFLWQQYTIYQQQQQLAQVKDMFDKAQGTIQRLEDANQALAVVNETLKEQFQAFNDVDNLLSVTNDNGEVKDVAQLTQILHKLNDQGNNLSDPIVQQKCQLAIKYVEILIEMSNTTQNQQEKINELTDDIKVKEQMILSLEQEKETLQKSLKCESTKNTKLSETVSDTEKQLTDAKRTLALAKEAFERDLETKTANTEKILKELDDAQKLHKYLEDTKASLTRDMEGQVQKIMEANAAKTLYFEKLQDANEKLKEKESQLSSQAASSQEIKLQLTAARLAYTTQKVASDAMIAQHDATIQVMMTKTAKQIEEMNKGHQQALTQIKAQMKDTHNIAEELNKLDTTNFVYEVNQGAFNYSEYKADQKGAIQDLRQTMERTLQTYSEQIQTLNTMITGLKSGSAVLIEKLHHTTTNMDYTDNVRVPFSAAVSSLVTYLTQQVILDESKMKYAEAEFKFYEHMINCAEKYRDVTIGQTSHDRVNYIRSMGQYRTSLLTYNATSSVLTHCRGITNRLGTDCIPECWKFVLESVEKTWEGTSYMYFWNQGALDETDTNISKEAARLALNSFATKTPKYKCPGSWSFENAAKTYWK